MNADADDVIVADGEKLARYLRCTARQVRSFAEEGLAVRVAPGRYDLCQSVGNVVEHLRTLAAAHQSADGEYDAVKSNAALKDAQRRLTDLRYAQLDGQLIALPEVEMLWSDLVRSARDLFLTFPARARFDLPQLNNEDQLTLERLSRAMLHEVALQGQPPLPAGSDDGSTDAA